MQNYDYNYLNNKIMDITDLLRDQSHQLKNEISDLKNAFDLNRDILKILSSQATRNDPQHQLYFQIITRLTSVNNQAMINSVELIHEKHVIKQENFRLNQQIKKLEQQLEDQIQLNRKSIQIKQSHQYFHEQVNRLSTEIMAMNEERIIMEQDLQYWKDRCKKCDSNGQYQNHTHTHKHNQTHKHNHHYQEGSPKKSLTRKYLSAREIRLQGLYNELRQQNDRLKRYVDQLQNRLLIMIKAMKMEEKLLQQNKQKKNRINQLSRYQNTKNEIRLLKYALNSITLQKKQNQYILSITERFKQQDFFPKRSPRSHNWHSKSFPKTKKYEKRSDSKSSNTSNDISDPPSYY